MRPFASLDRWTRVFVVVTIVLAVAILPIGELLQPIPTGARIIGELVYLAVGAQLAQLMPVRWRQGGVQLVSTPLLIATALVAPGAGVALVIWLSGYDGRRPGVEVSWWTFLFNVSNRVLAYGLPSLLYAYLPVPPSFSFSVPLETVVLTLAVICINYPLAARVFAAMTRAPFIQTLVENVGFTTIRSQVVMGFLGGMLYLVLRQFPEGWVMAVGLFGILVAIRANFADAQQQSLERLQTLRLAAETLDARDPYTESHSQRVADLAAQIGDALSLNGREIEQLRTAGALHDLGKIGIRDDILNKSERLTDEEWELMKRHPEIGADMIAKHSALAAVAPLVRGHHERWNGTGYPSGLSAEDIPLGARILAVADSFDTISTARIYRPSKLTPLEAVQDITNRAGSWYDPLVVNGLRAIHNLPLLPMPETPEAPAFTQRGALRLLWTRPRFARLLTGSTISSLGDPMTTVASLVTVYLVTRDPAWIAVTYIVKAIATIVVSGLAGALPDRVPRARLILTLEISRAGILFMTPFLINHSIYVIFPILFALAAVNALVGPARQAALPELVEPREVGPANAGLSAASMIAGAAGYAIAGAVIWLSASAFWLFLVDALTFLVAGLLILGLGHLGGGVKTAGVWSGVSRTWAVRSARAHLLVAGAAAFFLSMSFPTLITLAYHKVPSLEGARIYTVLEVMLATGVVIGSIIVGRMRNIGSMTTVARGLLITGALSVGIAFSPWIWLVGVLLLIASAGNPVYTVGNITALMEASDATNRGAIMSSRFALVQLAVILGAGSGGLIGKFFSPEVAYGVLGIGLVGLALVTELLPSERPEIVPVTELEIKTKVSG